MTKYEINIIQKRCLYRNLFDSKLYTNYGHNFYVRYKNGQFETISIVIIFHIYIYDVIFQQ